MKKKRLIDCNDVILKAKVVSSYGPVNQDVGFDQIKVDRMKVKADRAKEHKDLLNARYDISKKTSPGVAILGGKPIPVGPTAKLQGINWADLDKDAINFHYIENK